MLRFSIRRSRTVATAVGAAMFGGAMLALIPSPMAQASQTELRPAGSISAATSSQTLFGSTISNIADLKLKTQEFGHMAIVHVYYTGLPSSNAWTDGQAEANHSAVVVSFNALPSTILSGAADATLRHFFDTAPTGHPIYYNYFHEPEDNIAHGEFTMAAYKDAWAHVVRLADAAHNADLHSTLVLMSYDFDPYAHRNWKNYLPSGGIISTVAWDTYPVDGYGLASPTTWMGPAIAASKAARLHWGVTEFGTATVIGRPAWLKSVASYVKSNGALFCTLYDSKIRGGQLRHGGTFWITDGPSISAWSSVVQGS